MLTVNIMAQILHTQKRILEPLINIMGRQGRPFKTFDVYGGESDGEASEPAERWPLS